LFSLEFHQKFFTETETATLTGICPAHLRSLAKERCIGTACCAVVAGKRAESWLFTKSDLAILSDLQYRCEH
jgi:ferredoxin-like protein FixX